MNPLPIHILARGVLESQGQILLCRNPKRGWAYLPGGHIESGEAAGEALLRELKEELGLSACTLGPYLGLLEYRFDENVKNGACHAHEYNLLFRVDTHGLEPSSPPVSLEPQSVSFFWHPIDRLESLEDLLPSSWRRLVPLWLQEPQKASAYFYSQVASGSL